MVRIAVLDGDVRVRDAELVRHDLRERRLVPLTLRLDAELEHALAGRVDTELCRVDHRKTRDVADLRHAGTDDLGERREADAHDLALGALLGLLLAELVVADQIERDVQRLLVVARVVLPAHRALVRELLRLDEVLAAQLGGVDAGLQREVLHQTLDQVRGLGDAERAPVGNAARRLVRVDTIDLAVRRLEVVRPRGDVEEAGRPLRRLRLRVEGTVVGEDVGANGKHLAVLRGRELALHVVIAGKARGHEILGTALDPLDRLADQQRGRGCHDVARVDRHLVAEATADVGRDDADLLLGQTCHQRKQRAMRVRGLARQVDRHLPGRLVVIGDCAAGLHRRRVDARVQRVELDDDVGVLEHAIRRVGIARLPREDVVVGLTFEVRADDRRVSVERLLRVGDHRQRVVIDVDTFERVLGLRRRLGDHADDLLALEADLVGRQDSLGVTREGRHPREAMLGEQVARHAGHDTRHRLGTRGVDRVDRGVGERRAVDRHEQHAGQLHVIDVIALAADEAIVLDALRGLPDRAAHGADSWRAHAAAPSFFLAA